MADNLSESHIDFLVHADPADVTTEDSGCARYLELSMPGGTEDDGEFLRIHSWSEAGGPHPVLDNLVGKCLRVTIQIVPEPRG